MPTKMWDSGLVQLEDFFSLYHGGSFMTDPSVGRSKGLFASLRLKPCMDQVHSSDITGGCAKIQQKHTFSVQHAYNFF